MIQAIRPGDALEAQQLADTLRWIESGVEIFRVEKPATPPSICFLFCSRGSGGEKDNVGGIISKRVCGCQPAVISKRTNIRKQRLSGKYRKELHMPADFLSPEPLLLTQAVTVNMAAGHTDVSLWYVVRADSKKKSIMTRASLTDADGSATTSSWPRTFPN